MSLRSTVGKNSVLIDALHSLVAASVAVFFIWADFLDTSTKANRAGEEAIYHLIAPLHGPRLPREPVVVVTIAKSDLDAINAIKLQDYPGAAELPAAEAWTWPLDGYKHAEIVREIDAYAPMALFYDINFAQRRDGMIDFGAEIAKLTAGAPGTSDCRLPQGQKAGTAVFLSYERGSPPLRELCGKGADGAITGWLDQGDNYPLMEIWAQCPDAICGEGAPTPGAPLTLRNIQIRKTAAFAMYATWCGDRRKTVRDHQCARLIEQALNEAGRIAAARLSAVNAMIPSALAAKTDAGKQAKIKSEFERPQYLAAPLSLQWGLGVSPQQKSFTDLSEANCAVTPDDPIESLGVFLSRARDALLATVKLAEPGSTYFRCAYPLTIPLKVLMYPPDPEALKSALKGKLVLIGSSDITGLGDFVASPVHGQLPGVYAHAQALDNLLRFGGSPVFDVVRHGTDEALISWRNLFYFLLMTLFLFLSFRIGRIALRGAISFDHLIQHGSPVRLWVAVRRSSTGLVAILALGMLALAIPALVAAFLYWVTRTAPMDWVGIVVAMSVVLVGIVWRLLGQIVAELAVAIPATSGIARDFLKQIRD